MNLVMSRGNSVTAVQKKHVIKLPFDLSSYIRHTVLCRKYCLKMLTPIPPHGNVEKQRKFEPPNTKTKKLIHKYG